MGKKNKALKALKASNQSNKFDGVPPEQLCSVYTLNGIKNKDAIRLKHIDTFIKDDHNESEEMQLRDTCIKQYNVMKGVVGLVYVCNMTHHFLTTTKKLPMVYIKILRELPLRSIYLMTIKMYFTITSEVHTEEELLNKPLHGTFSIEAYIGDKTIPLDQNITVFPGHEKLVNQLIEFTENEDMLDIINDLVEMEDEKLREKAREELEYYTIPTNVISLKNYKPPN
jgi:hypothetical protein